ncbi:MAG TPA: hypothetical protein VL020_04975 [Pseudomonadales bacterium]|nr:hypothetical protein [Pseudomonadales bacterium]
MSESSISADMKRELEKIKEAVDLATTYHAKINEANSALHSSDRVLYSPMTNKLILAQQSLERILQDD